MPVPDLSPIELTAANCAGYLAGRDEIGGADPREVKVRELGGGVSNRVLLVEAPGNRFILKQSLGKLRVEDDWRADRSRIAREVAALRDAARFLPAGAAPEVLWTDEANFLFAMTAVDEPAETWKAQLLAGHIEASVAAKAGVLLGLWIRNSWENAGLARYYGDQTVFYQLRIDPYYRTAAQRRPEVATRVEELIATSAARRVSLVHGDWSPKNFLVGPQGVTVIDFEVTHYGDPAFDAAFCINHFLLKCFHLPGRASELIELARTFYTWLEAVVPAPALRFLEPATAQHLGCLLLARVDGKSPAEYLAGEPVRQAVRRAATRIILEQPSRLEACYAIVADELQGASHEF